MASLSVRTTFDACHGTRDVRRSTFIVEVVIQGPVLSGFVAGIDDVVVRGRLESEVYPLRGKLLDDVFGRATLESLAAFLIASLADITVFAVCVEQGPSKVTVLADEINLQTWPAELAFQRAASLLLRGREVSALVEFSQAIDVAPGWAAAYNARGRCFRQLGDKKRAFADFERALLLDPNFGEAYRNKGNILLEYGQPTIALQSFDRAIDCLPESALAYNNRGYALQRSGEFLRAVSDHQQALRLNPTYAEAFRDLADACEHLGQEVEAQAARNEASRLDLIVDKLADERAKIVHVPCSPMQLAGAEGAITELLP